jgi:hypothetical protein
VPDQIREIVDSLPKVKDVKEIWNTAEARLVSGDPSFLGDLGVAIVARFGVGQGFWQARGVFDRLLRLLAITPGEENLIQALRLISAAHSCGRKLERYAASQLAAGQPPTDLAAVVFGGSGGEGDASEELRACLIHELVLREVALSELQQIAKWAASPHWRHHPLSWLPLELSGIEQERSLPSYSARGVSSYATPYGPTYGRGETKRLMSGPGAPVATEATTAEVAASISAAVENWTQGSNGRIEARVFDFAEEVGDAVVPGAVLASGLECLRDLEAEGAFSVTARTAAEAWRVLFAAASSGGAYNHGCYGAYGRLLAWRSIAALAGIAQDATAAEVAERAQECSWYRFDADSPWFEQVAWDIGLAALDPRRSRLAVLAATDTD